METLFEGSNAWFAAPAILGTGVFLIRLVLMLVGGAGDGGDFGGGDVGDVGDLGDLGGDAGADHMDSGHAFEILSIQSISAFLMGFGWGGLAGLKGAGLGLGLSLALGVGCGCLMVWILAVLLRGLYSLEGSGNVSIRDALGAEGEIYAQVPARGAGVGQVKVVVSDRMRIYRAVSDGSEVPTRTRVRVVRVNSDNTLTVEPA